MPNFKPARVLARLGIVPLIVSTAPWALADAGSVAPADEPVVQMAVPIADGARAGVVQHFISPLVAQYRPGARLVPALAPFNPATGPVV